jgi:hypothetical protein
MRDPDGVHAFFRQRGVVDDQVSVWSADEFVAPVGVNNLNGSRVPRRGRHEVVDLLFLIGRDAVDDRLDALALARQDEPAKVDGRPSAPDLVLERIEVGREPTLKLPLPLLPGFAHRAREWNTAARGLTEKKVAE